MSLRELCAAVQLQRSWTDREVDAVAEKLAAIGVRAPCDLLLRTDRDVQRALQRAGLKVLTGDSIRALREAARAGVTNARPAAAVFAPAPRPSSAGSPASALERTFGVEIEVLLSPQALTHHLRSRVPELQLCETRYSDCHTVLSDRRWLVKPDRSVPSGCELVSPILTGDHDLVLLHKVISALDSAGANLVDESCGLHVHVGDADFAGSPGRVSSLACVYDAAFGMLEREMMLPSRRGNEYCKRSDERDLQLARTGTLSFECCARDRQDHHGRTDADRRVALNMFHSKVRGNTVEFRQHHGTTNPDEASRTGQGRMILINAGGQRMQGAQLSMSGLLAALLAAA